MARYPPSLSFLPGPGHLAQACGPVPILEAEDRKGELFSTNHSRVWGRPAPDARPLNKPMLLIVADRERLLTFITRCPGRASALRRIWRGRWQKPLWTPASGARVGHGQFEPPGAGAHARCRRNCPDGGRVMVAANVHRIGQLLKKQEERPRHWHKAHGRAA